MNPVDSGETVGGNEDETGRCGLGEQLYEIRLSAGQLRELVLRLGGEPGQDEQLVPNLLALLPALP